MNPEQQAPAPAQPTISGYQNNTQAPGGSDTMGIISIVLDCVGLPFVGFILGLVGASKAKREGRSPTLSRIGWILGLVVSLVAGAILFFTFAVTLFAGVQEAANESLQQAQQEDQRRNATLRADSKLACLTEAEIESVIEYTSARFPDYVTEDEDVYYLENVFFITDSTTYEFAPAAPALFDDLATLYDEFPNKNFTYAVQGKSSKDVLSAADDMLTSSRYEQIKQELIDRGVPAQKIESVPPSTGLTGELSDRTVEVLAITNCTE